MMGPRAHQVPWLVSTSRYAPALDPLLQRSPLYSDPLSENPGFAPATIIQCIVIVLNDVTSKSHEQRLTTKEHIAMHTNLIFLLCTPVL